ncbi:MAG: dihydrodipicolinate synthase family protein [Candidatus Thermoplasmatota archaeon]
MFEGSITALVIPFKGKQVDFDGLAKLINYQEEYSANGISIGGIISEIRTFDEPEYKKVLRFFSELTDIVKIAGNYWNAEESLKLIKDADEFGIENWLIDFSYYKCKSSLEIRKEYLEPIANKFPNMNFIPYLIPHESQLHPQDLAILSSEHKNINAVNVGIENFENIKMIRRLCGRNFEILSGDDSKTYEMMTDKAIMACGAISVIANLFPREAKNMVDELNKENFERGEMINNILMPMFEIIKIEKPLKIKTLMNLLGMPGGNCRETNSKLTKNEFYILVDACRKCFKKNREIFEPIEECFNVNVEERLYKDKYLKGLYY